jgi:hypothetical protein
MGHLSDGLWGTDLEEFGSKRRFDERLGEEDI